MSGNRGLEAGRCGWVRCVPTGTIRWAASAVLATPMAMTGPAAAAAASPGTPSAATPAATRATPAAASSTPPPAVSLTTMTVVSRCVRPDGRVEYTDGECAPGERTRALPIELRSVDPREQREALHRAREDYERVTRRLDARLAEEARLAQQRRELARRDALALPYPSQVAVLPAWSLAPTVPVLGAPVYGTTVYGASSQGVRATWAGARPHGGFVAAPSVGAPPPAPPTRGSYKP